MRCRNGAHTYHSLLSKPPLKAELEATTCCLLAERILVPQNPLATIGEP
jgi:hypothetical protein